MKWRDRKIETLRMRVGDIQPHPMNPKIHPAGQLAPLRGLLETVGKLDDLKAYRSERAGGALVFFDGHGRRELDPEAEWDVDVYDLTDAEADLAVATFDPIGWQAEQSRVMLDNLLREVSTGDAALMELIAKEAEAAGIMSSLAGGDSEAIDQGEGEANQPRASLADRFIIPPFSVLDARQGYWQERKRAWLSLGIKSEVGRGDGVHQYSEAATIKRDGGRLGHDGSAVLRERNNNGLLGESEQARSHYKNAAPGGSLRPAMTVGDNGKTQRGDGAGKPIKDPARCFGQDLMRGEHTVGETSSLKGGLTHGTTIHPYDGSSSDVQSGTSIFDPVLCELAYRWFCPPAGAILDPFAGGSVRGIVAAKLDRAYTGLDLRPEQIAANEAQAKEITPANAPRWITGDSREIGTLAPGEYDLIFSCPPYADLEVYSDDPRDISTLNYADFLAAYRAIIAASLAMLKADRFACFVVGDVRDKKGIYRNFVSDTIAAFQDAGARLYNEAILVTSVGSLPIRVGRQFESGRKLGKTHQNVLVFVKGDPKKATDACGKIDVFDPAEAFGEVAE